MPVDLELSLVIDVSGSVNTSEYNLQRDGYANGLRDAANKTAIVGGTEGAIAVNAVFFSSSAQESIPFTLLDSVTAINSFADTLGNFSRPFSGGTTIASGINLAVGTFGSETGGAGSGDTFLSSRQVIDVSGDGTSFGPTTQAARDAAIAAGIDAINGLAIENSPNSTVITDFYRDNVIAGTGAFVETATGFDTFDQAVGAKLKREIIDSNPNPPPPGPNPVPEPSTLVCWIGLGLLGLVQWRRKK